VQVLSLVEYANVFSIFLLYWRMLHSEVLTSIYIKKKVCLSVRYAFSPCNSYDHQTFHDACLGPKEGRRGVKISNQGEGAG
jgi:hypothetical protein